MLNLHRNVNFPFITSNQIKTEKYKNLLHNYFYVKDIIFELNRLVSQLNTSCSWTDITNNTLFYRKSLLELRKGEGGHKCPIMIRKP